MLTFDGNKDAAPRNSDDVRKLLGVSKQEIPEGYSKRSLRCRCIHEMQFSDGYYCKGCPEQMSSDNVMPMPARMTDKEIADDLRKRCAELMKPVLALMDEAAQHHMKIQWDGVHMIQPFNKHQIVNLSIIKHL